MSNDTDLKTNLLIGSSTAIAACIGGVCVYRTVRPWFHIKVCCWFCQSITKVPYGNRNCWDCPKCEQYNGFSKDGDYNKPIPAQWSGDLNHPITAETQDRSPAHFNSGSDQLCDTCNQNQLLKVRQLSNFIPYNEANFDQEVAAYKSHLEQIYHLCVSCEVLVQRLLQQQDITLAQKLQSSLHSHNASHNHSAFTEENFHMDSSQASGPSSKSSTVFRIFNLILSILLVLSLLLPGEEEREEEEEEKEEEEAHFLRALSLLHTHHLSFLIAGLLSSLMAVFLSGKHRIHGMDALAVLSWLLTYLFHSPAVISILPMDDYSQLQMTVALICCMVCACVVILPRRRHRPVIRMHKKRRSRELNGSAAECAPVTPPPTPPPSKPRARVDPLDEFETLSIGRPSNPWTAASEAPFRVYPGEPLPSRLQSDVISSLGKKKPLIMPAKFMLQKNTMSSEPFRNEGLPTLFSDVRNRQLSSRIESDRASLFSVHRTPSQSGESSEESGAMGVEEEAEEEEVHVCQPVRRQKRTLLKQILVGVFLGINIFISANFLFTHLPSVLSMISSRLD